MELIFILLSVIYVTSLAIIDSLVNRLIFREHHKLSYFSSEKKDIYKLSEWVLYCALFVIVLPVFPIFICIAFLGIKYVLIYIIVLAIFDWDLIFGKIVFNNWFGDLPSICLPRVG